MTNDASAVAKSVALALGLKHVQSISHRTWDWWSDDDQCYLKDDGSNLFDPHWFKRCVLWLLKRSDKITSVELYPNESLYWAYDVGKEGCVNVFCPAEEAPARLIHALLTRTEEP